MLKTLLYRFLHKSGQKSTDDQEKSLFFYVQKEPFLNFIYNITLNY